MNQLYSEIFENPFTIGIKEIPVVDYDVFYNNISGMLSDQANHCVAYYGVEVPGYLKLICCIVNDKTHSIRIFSTHLINEKRSVKSLTSACPQLHIFEREIHENFGVEFEGHPWLKPVRYPYNRKSLSALMDNYPFYEIESEELHEVGVGPVHAGVIEPGHFRFICNGEKVLHLEIQLGYQHRGIEKLFIHKKGSLQKCILSESIAGDTSVGHSLAHSQLIDSMGDLEISDSLQIERCIGLELERIAVHIGDTAALCGDIAYQLGQVVCEALRTEIINTTQFWCGNRFGKGLVRPGGSNFPMSDIIADKMLKMLDDAVTRFSEIAGRIYSMPSVLARFEDIGQVTRDQALKTGSVGMAARTCGIGRDLRGSHPFQYFKKLYFNPVINETGDVLARGMLRVKEISESGRIIRELLGFWKEKKKFEHPPVYNYLLKPESFSLSMAEGWRGEICHSAITDENGNIIHYKVKDPSFHNWMALALAVRNQEISDFPVCNKSFNLSYCGNDL
ncbi:MAG TPA: NADH dehydrogenase subunit [Bacteroidales bacterium]|jgi:Ni,Fe-hydrogenase III large subunit/NADH:ubiquinone oxidoreductase subunit C|nr:NADH dehydrogenase subunit [Bacteroidales bacterium]HBZ19613.1 NADH dehydrogenase subunit [Bacteroidales bacterium]